MVKRPDLELNSLQFDGVAASISKAQLRKMQANADIVLPDEFQEFLLLHNGGCPKKSWFYVNGESQYVSRFLRVDDEGFLPNEDSEPFSIAFHRATLEPFVPPGFLIIGIVVRDDFLVLNLRTGEIGHVTWEMVSELEEVPASVVTVLAASLTDFLRKLRHQGADMP